MPRQALRRGQKDALRKSDRAAVQTALSQLDAYMRHGRWLGTKNTYRRRQPRQPINDKHLREYIAASAPLHCADGWSFLGRTLDCHARGDADGARHLGYYAELRGAISLLAAEGIGIFDRYHAVVDSSGNCWRVPGDRLRTHIMAWLALKHWAGLRRSADLLANVVAPGGLPLQHWLDAFPTASATWHPIGDRWLRTWGLDLRRMASDREARNEASYRPTHHSPVGYLSALDCCAAMRNLWTVYEPSSASRFELLDRHLLRLSLEATFKAVTGRRSQDDVSGYETRVVRMLEAVEPIGLPLEEWKRFLTRDVHPEDPLIITEGAGCVTPKNPRHHVQVMSRAALLLRVATGACASLLRAAGPDRGRLAFWWEKLGEERQLWGSADEPAELVDLWADVETALDELHRWETEASRAPPSHAQWRRDHPYEICVLGQCERIALWGLGL